MILGFHGVFSKTPATLLTAMYARPFTSELLNTAMPWNARTQCKCLQWILPQQKSNRFQILLTLVTAWRKAALPTFCLCRFIIASIRLFSLSMCRLFSSNFNLTLSNWDPMTPVSLVLSATKSLFVYHQIRTFRDKMLAITDIYHVRLKSITVCLAGDANLIK